MSWINFIQKRRPTAIFASAKNAKAFAEKVASMNTSIKDVLPKAKTCILYGKDIDRDRTELSGPYATLEFFEVYSPTEHMTFCSECSSHSGVHVWLDTAIPEIIPGGHTQAELLSEAKAGTSGELVITNFSKALPLIRYKTGKSIQVEGGQDCSCGCTHPKVKFN
jgi:phenylacetate-coenzyme A ligase PaaK-like adenylate-forming protein